MNLLETYYTITDKLHKLFRRHITIKSDTECWIYKGCKNSDGYGIYREQGKTYLAHRYSFERINGYISNILVLDHLCENRSCVNPKHLEEVTRAVNTQRRKDFAIIKTHCVNGHFFDIENTYITSRGHRACRKCKYLDNKKRKDMKKQLKVDDNWDWVY